MGGTSNQYQWEKDGIPIEGAMNSDYTIETATRADSGAYLCRITNTVVTDLTLYSRPYNVYITSGLTHFQKDSLALVALYDSTDGNNWTNNENWKTGPLNTWYGVLILNDRVSRISLQNNNLAGTIPVEMGNLTNLTELVLGDNQLTGTIPVEIGNLTDLTYLSFHNNQLTGTILPEIGNLTNLTYLCLSQNQFTGTIPTGIKHLTNLSNLALSDNQLSGSIPTDIWNLTELNNLSIDHNQLTGTIPEDVGNLTKLTSLYLNENQLTGVIPAEIGNLTDLIYLELSNNQLSGTIPVEIGNLIKLKRLTLYENQLTGAIPHTITNLIQLEYFIIQKNRFSDLPDMSSLTSFISLFVHENNLTFEDIEPNIGITGFTYIPQDSVGEQQDTTITEGEILTLSVDVGGAFNQYQWIKDGIPIEGAVDSEYVIEAATLFDSGDYACQITNTVVTDLTLNTRDMIVHVISSSDISDEQETTPDRFNLFQNYPNPFNPETIIQYHVAKACHVSLKVYNVKGQEITTLVNSHQHQGKYTVLFNMKTIPSGIYFYKIEMNDFSEIKKMTKLE